MLSSRNRAKKGSRPHGRVAAAFASTLAVASAAQAAGVEDTVGGAVGLGRAANFARVNDFMATWQNPANLAVIPGGDLGVELRVPLLQACFDRARDPDAIYKESAEGDEPEYGENLLNICKSGLPGPTGNIGYAQSFPSGWGWGLGLFTPAAGGGAAKWGNDTIVTLSPQEDEEYSYTTGGTESGTRQMLLERDAVIAYLMAGLGWAPVKQLRLGVSGGIGFANIYNKSVASVIGGTFKDQEIINELSVSDYAIPRANLGVVISPFDWIDLFGTATYQGDVNGEGHVDLTANGFLDQPLTNCRDKQPGTHCRLQGAKLTVPFPTYEATVGLRIAQRREPRQQVLDPMKDELWDFEVDVNWAQSSHVDQLRINLHNDPNPEDPDDPDERVPGIQFSSSKDEGIGTSVPNRKVNIPKYWKDTWAFRAGGDINVIRDRLALRLGGSYQTRAIRKEFMAIDDWPVRKIGVHLGATLKFAQRFKATIAYAHLFYENIDVPVGTGRVREISTLMSDRANAVNEGSYRAALDVVSIQLNAAF